MNQLPPRQMGPNSKVTYIPKWNQKVFDAVRMCLKEASGRIESSTDIVRILRGSRSISTVECQSLSTYGLLRGYKRFYLRSLVEFLEKENVNDLASYIVLVGENGDENSIVNLLVFLGSKDSNVRRLVCSALGKIGSSIAERPLVGMLFDQKPQVRQYAINALGKVGTTYSLPILKMISNSRKDKEYNVAAAKEAMLSISRRSD